VMVNVNDDEICHQLNGVEFNVLMIFLAVIYKFKKIVKIL